MKCPGQDRRYWTGSAVVEVPCPECGSSVEIFRDESTGRCLRCGHRFVNPGADFGCAQWCSLAKECLGFAPPSQPQTDSTASAMAARLILHVEDQFKNDPTSIAYALRVFQFAKELVRKEGGNPRVVLSGALLVATSTPAPGAGADSAAPPSGQSEATPPTETLKRLGLDEDTCEKVCRIVDHCRSGEDLDAVEFRIVWDSEKLARLGAQRFAGEPGRLEDAIISSLRTETGKSKARSLFHGRPTSQGGSPVFGERRLGQSPG